MIDFPTDEEIKADIDLRLPELSRVHKGFAFLILKSHRDELIERAKCIDKILINQTTPEQIEILKKFTGS